MNVLGHSKKVLVGGLIAGCMMLISTTTLTGCLTSDTKDTTKTDTTTTGTHTQFDAATSISAGAQGALGVGSVLDLDTKTALTSAQANAAQASIDLVFLYYTGYFYLDNAVAARAAGIANNINLTNGYDATVIKDVKIVKISTTPADQEAAKAAFAAGTASPSNIISGGEKFLVMTTEGKLALVTVGAISGTDKTGTDTFTVTLSTIAL